MHEAAEIDNLEIIEALLGANADKVAVDEDGNIPLHFAVTKNKLDNVEALLRAGVRTDLVNNAGFTPLRLAVDIGHQGIIKTMIRWTLEKCSDNCIENECCVCYSVSKVHTPCKHHICELFL